MSISHGDKAVATLRTLIAVIEREIASAVPTDELRVAWTQMVEVLALGPAPELRECPICCEVGMRAATRCMRCWSPLAPLPLPDAPSGS
jgi:hypothetical protein